MSAIGRYLDICLHCKPGYLLWADTQTSDLGRYLGIYFGQIPRYLLGQIPKCMLCLFLLQVDTLVSVLHRYLETWFGQILKYMLLQADTQVPALGDTIKEMNPKEMSAAMPLGKDS